MQSIILSVDDIRSIVNQVGLDTMMDEMIRRLTRAFTEFDPRRTVVPARAGFSYQEPQPGLVEWMPVMNSCERVTLKVVGYHPGNPDLHQLPTILSTVSAYDTSNGHLIGIADCTFLTALRTGAASAVASQVLAAEDSRVLGVIGCGAQAVTQIHAISRLFPLEQIVAYDTNPLASSSLRERIRQLGIPVQTVEQEDLPGLVQAADILCTCTSVAIGKGPVFTDTGVKPGLHINAIGSDFPGKFELPRSLLKRSFVCPDFLEQAVQEGECQQLKADEIGPGIAEVVKNQARYQSLRQQVTVFDSTGWALEDQAALEMLMDYAADLGLGARMELESISNDPHNPYAFLNGSASFSSWSA
jgi:ornithine cyclodeaminase/alanine dehydrogenase-like protein (mu-crystallin family)